MLDGFISVATAPPRTEKSTPRRILPLRQVKFILSNRILGRLGRVRDRTRRPLPLGSLGLLKIVLTWLNVVPTMASWAVLLQRVPRGLKRLKINSSMFKRQVRESMFLRRKKMDKLKTVVTFMLQRTPKLAAYGATPRLNPAPILSDPPKPLANLLDPLLSRPQSPTILTFLVKDKIVLAKPLSRPRCLIVLPKEIPPTHPVISDVSKATTIVTSLSS